MVTRVTIDLTRGIPVEEVPDHFPRNRGRKIGSATAWRYVLTGIKVSGGVRVKLASFKAGGRRYVMPEAIQAFVDAISADTAAPPHPATPGTADRQHVADSEAVRRAEAADLALQSLGF